MNGLLASKINVPCSYLSLVVARLDGAIVRDLVGGNGKAFTYGILKWLGIGGPAVYCNAMVWPLDMLSLRLELTRSDQIPPSQDLHSVPYTFDTIYP